MSTWPECSRTNGMFCARGFDSKVTDCYQPQIRLVPDSIMEFLMTDLQLKCLATCPYTSNLSGNGFRFSSSTEFLISRKHNCRPQDWLMFSSGLLNLINSIQVHWLLFQNNASNPRGSLGNYYSSDFVQLWTSRPFVHNHQMVKFRLWGFPWYWVEGTWNWSFVNTWHSSKLINDLLFRLREVY